MKPSSTHKPGLVGHACNPRAPGGGWMQEDKNFKVILTAQQVWKAAWATWKFVSYKQDVHVTMSSFYLLTADIGYWWAMRSVRISILYSTTDKEMQNPETAL